MTIKLFPNDKANPPGKLGAAMRCCGRPWT